ncbi:MAG: MBL fold metallo-hydrolase RNA specificity domain-containing protein [Pseudomonadota bacterium]
MFEIQHHGAGEGVTGSCHELRLADGRAVLVDCGLFQGEEASPGGASFEQLQIDFPLKGVAALVVTHVHIDHVGRIPYLLAAGFRGPIYCSEPSAQLLPLVLEDALKVGFTRDRALIERFLQQVTEQLRPLRYGQWVALEGADPVCRFKLCRAGHILGSAFVEFSLRAGKKRERVLFSGDLGAPWTPLLPAPRSPYRADVVVLESTYGDRLHESRRQRTERLRATIEQALRNRGTVLVPAFSIGRTQELLYELEQVIHQHGRDFAAKGLRWEELEVIVDSPLAARFNRVYRRLRPFWDREAQKRLQHGRHPLSFEQLLTIDDHETHLRTVDYLATTARPAIVIAASGMCAGGRIVDYLKAMLGDARHDVLFVGYQAQGTPGRDIQQYGPRGGYVVLDGERYDIRAGVATIGGYSAHADRDDLVRFIKRMRRPPRQVRLVHGEPTAQAALKRALQRAVPGVEVLAHE